MTIAVTGPIATDRLMYSPGRFADRFTAEHIERCSPSILG